MLVAWFTSKKWCWDKVLIEPTIGLAMMSFTCLLEGVMEMFLPYTKHFKCAR
jgi:hypothetical protein